MQQHTIALIAKYADYYEVFTRRYKSAGVLFFSTSVQVPAR